MNSVLVLLFSFGVLLSQVKAMTPEQINEDFKKILFQCVELNPITKVDLDFMKDKKTPSNSAAKCLFACVYKKSGMMDEQGMLSSEGVHALSLKYYADDDAKMKISDEFTNACLNVNDEAVSDGAKGCDRAALIFDCSIKKTPAFDFI